MFRNRAEEMANSVALNMGQIMDSDEHKSVFQSPDPYIKTASDKKKDEKEDKKDKKKDKCKCKEDCKGGKKCKCECDECGDGVKSAADQLDLAIKGMAKISETLDNIGLEKSALVTLKALNSIVSEAMGEMPYDSNYAKDKKEDKKEDKDDKDDKDEKEDKEDEKDKSDKKDSDKEDDKEDDKKKDKKDDNDANDPLADVERRMEQERSGLAPGNVIQSGKPGESIPAPPGSEYERIPVDSNKDDDGGGRVNHGVMTPEERYKAMQQAPVQHHGTTAPVKEAPKAEPEPKHKREYKQPWERDSFDIDMDDDGANGRVNHGVMTPEERYKAMQQAPVQHHGTTAPVKEAPKAEPEPKHKREYKQPWERDSFEINMSDDKKKDEPTDVTVEIIDDGEELRQIMEELGIDDESQDSIMEDVGMQAGE